MTLPHILLMENAVTDQNLFAAAPDMYNALQNLLKCMENAIINEHLMGIGANAEYAVSVACGMAYAALSRADGGGFCPVLIQGGNRIERR